MRYYVYDEEGMMMRCFQHRKEAEAYLQDGWTIQVKKIIKRDGYSVAILTLGEALI